MKKYPTVTIRIDQDLLDRINKAAGMNYVSRSTLIRTAIMLYLEIHHPRKNDEQDL